MVRFSYAHGASDLPLLGDCIGENLRRTVEAGPDQLALVVRHQGVRLSYQQLWEEVEQVARGLMALGIQKGDRVGIWSPNRYEWVISQYATARMGAILVNVNPAYRSSELKYVLRQAEVRLLLMSKGFRSTDYVEILAGVRDECEALEHVVVLDEAWRTLHERAHEVSPAELHERECMLSCDDPINIQYTSGTTGAPKGATLSHHNILNNGYFIAKILDYGPEDRICVPVPFYHCFGMVIGNLAATSSGAAVVVPGEAFDPKATLAAAEAERCTSMYGVPTMFIAQLEHPEFERFDLSSLRTGVMAGSPCPVEVMKKVQTLMHMPEVTICYGMTETSPVSAQSRRDDPVQKRVDTVGRIHPHVEVKIIDPASGRTLPLGEQGELCTRGYSVMLGYWNDPEATRTAIDGSRWMHTGDLATMDEQGYVRITGRIKDMIIRGGENIYPREVEEFLYTHPDVSDAQVIGVPCPKYGEQVMAWVKLREGASLEAAELHAFCKGRMATFKIPSRWKFVDAFPMTVTGKVQKFRMREIAVDELGRHG